LVCLEAGKKKRVATVVQGLVYKGLRGGKRVWATKGVSGSTELDLLP